MCCSVRNRCARMSTLPGSEPIGRYFHSLCSNVTKTRHVKLGARPCNIIKLVDPLQPILDGWSLTCETLSRCTVVALSHPQEAVKYEHQRALIYRVQCEHDSSSRVYLDQKHAHWIGLQCLNRSNTSASYWWDIM